MGRIPAWSNCFSTRLSLESNSSDTSRFMFIPASDVTECLKIQRAVLILLIPKIFNSRNRNDFPKTSKGLESLWIELTLPYKKFLSMRLDV